MLIHMTLNHAVILKTISLYNERNLYLNYFKYFLNKHFPHVNFHEVISITALLIQLFPTGKMPPLDQTFLVTEYFRVYIFCL